MRYSRKPRDDSRENRQARATPQQPAEDTIKVFGPMQTNVRGKSTELWLSVNETTGTTTFCDTEGTDLSSDIMHLDAVYSADSGGETAFVDALLMQLPPAEIAAAKASGQRARAKLESRMAARSALLTAATRWYDQNRT